MKNLRIDVPRCGRCKKPLPDLHWIVRLSPPAQDRFGRVCAPCKADLGPILETWKKLHEGATVQWSRGTL